MWLSATIADLADGVLLAAAPLLVASITREPFPIAMAVFAQRLPWLLFGIVAGAIIDRLDRRMLMVAADALRAVVLAVLVVAAALGTLNLGVIYVTMFLLGTAETFADNAGSVLVAVTVPKDGLGEANARMFGSRIVANQLAGPPLGALLFGISLLLPFGFGAGGFLVAAALVASLGAVPPDGAEPQRASLRAEVTEGMRWLWGHAPMRTLTIMVTVFNVTFGAAFAVWVLYAYEVLGLNEFGFGLLLTGSAVGGVLGTFIYRRLERRFSYATLLRAGLCIETLTHVALAATANTIFAATVMVAFGVHATVWGTTASTVRQLAVPDRLQGRVTSVYLLGGVGALAVGAALGGAIAQRWGVVAPFWFAAVGAAITTAWIWRSLSNVAAAAQDGPADLPPEMPPGRSAAG